MIVADHGTAVDLHYQGLQFMAQIAHGADTRHSGSAFEGMQMTLQFRDWLLVVAVAIPGGQRFFRRLEQFGRLFAVDVCDLVIELLRSRERRDHGRRAGVNGIAGDRGVEFDFDVVQPHEQRRLVREKCRRFVDMRYHVVDRANRFAQCCEPLVGQSITAVEDFAHDLIQRFGDSDAVPRFGHLRAAAQGVDGAIHRLRQFVRWWLTRAFAQVFANLGQVARRLLAVNVMQHGIHRRRCGGGHPGPGRRCAILGRQGHGALIRFAAVGVGEGAGHQRLERHRIVPPRFQLFHQLRQGGDRAAQQSHHSGCA